jgi:hypothetical protein
MTNPTIRWITLLNPYTKECFAIFLLSDRKDDIDTSFKK